MIDAHPALKAASPQAPTADCYMGDDLHHNGAFMLGANFGFYSGFVARGATPEPPKPALRFDPARPTCTTSSCTRRSAGADECRALRRQGGVLEGDHRPHRLRRVLEEAVALEVHGRHEMRGADRRRLVRRRGPDGPAAHLPRGRGEEPRHGQHAGDGAVVARRLGARRRADARQPRTSRSRPASSSASTSSSRSSWTT